MSKSGSKRNPMPVKTYSPNVEPWLTYRELLEEGLAISRGYRRAGLNLSKWKYKE